MRTIGCLWLVLLIPWNTYAQQPQLRPQFMRAGIVEHHGSNATVRANDPRPLLQAIKAIREEYGWIIDYEDPPFFSAHDLSDDTDPRWKAAHPGSDPVWRIAGSAFQSDYPEIATAVPSSPRIADILQKVVSDYNSSGNPGKFSVRKESSSRYSILGTFRKDRDGRDQAVRSILDTAISMPPEPRTPVETLYTILSILSSATGTRVLPLMVPTNTLQGPLLTIGGTGVTARTLLLQTLGQANPRRTLMWDLLFDPDPNTNAYLMNIEVVTKTTQDGSGHVVLRPLGHVKD
jgi:hypothetical protein